MYKEQTLGEYLSGLGRSSISAQGCLQLIADVVPCSLLHLQLLEFLQLSYSLREAWFFMQLVSRH